MQPFKAVRMDDIFLKCGKMSLILTVFLFVWKVRSVKKQKMYLDRFFALRKENARENGGLQGIPIDKVGIPHYNH